MPKELTTDEVRDRFLQHVRGIVDYWVKEDRCPPGEDPVRWRVSGAAFSILVALDGGSVGLPGFIVAPQPHPDDKDHCQREGADWYPENHDVEVKADIAGCLHELLHAAPSR